jgi:hypothetical protein
MKLYEGGVGILLFTSSLLLPLPPSLQSSRASELLHSTHAQLIDVRQDPSAQEQDVEEQDYQCVNQLGAL